MALENKTCCKLETGALIYGIINAIINGVIILCFIGLIAFVGIGLTDVYRNDPVLPRRATQSQMAIEMIHLLICTPLALIAFIFSVLLILGVTKKKPALVLSYFIFGILVTGVSVAGAISYQVATLNGVVAAVSFSLILIYALPLVVVFMTFRKLRAAATYQPNYGPLHTKNLGLTLSLKFYMGINGLIPRQNGLDKDMPWYIVEVGTFIYGMMSILLNGAGSIVLIILLTQHVFDDDDVAFNGKSLFFWLRIAAVTSVLRLICNVLLIVGLSKKNPALLLTYLIFGVTFIPMAGCIVYHISEIFKSEDYFNCGVCVMCLYALPLVLVFKSYRNMRHSTRSATIRNKLQIDDIILKY